MAPTLRQLLARSAARQDDAAFHESVLTAAEADSSADALPAQVVALLKLDRFGDAAARLKAAGAAAREMPLLQAYAQYKLGAEDEVLAAAQGHRCRALSHVRAQAVGDLIIISMFSRLTVEAYRAGDYELAWQTYESIPRIPEESSDLDINTAAVAALMAWSKGKDMRLGTLVDASTMGSFELAYNEACVAIAGNRLWVADALLRRAKGAWSDA
jgi:signal recognition particle subunit SRP72